MIWGSLSRARQKGNKRGAGLVASPISFPGIKTLLVGNSLKYLFFLLTGYIICPFVYAGLILSCQPTPHQAKRRVSPWQRHKADRRPFAEKSGLGGPSGRGFCGFQRQIRAMVG